MSKILFIGLLFVLIVPPKAWSQNISDSARIHYRQGHKEVDVLFRNNCAELDRFIRTLRKEHKTGCLESVVIHSWASPEGVNRFNELLSQRRADSLKSYLVQQAQIPDSIVKVHGEGIAWDILRRMVVASDMLYKREVLHILDHTPVWVFDKSGRVVDGRKKQLMDLRGGLPYTYMLENFFPDLRSSLSVACYRKSEPDMTGVPENKEKMKEAETVVQSDTVAVVSMKSVTEPQAATKPEISPARPWYIKSNLLYDAVLMPSLEVEYRFNERWSAAIEGNMAWWHNNGKHKYYQLATIVPEARWWFRPQGARRGHYLGLFGGGGWYDLENGGTGYKGTGGMVGLSYGYMFPVGKRFAFEAGIGAGFMTTRYEEYLPLDGHYVYQQTSRTNYFGPLKLKFAFVWNIGRSAEKGGNGK